MLLCWAIYRRHLISLSGYMQMRVVIEALITDTNEHIYIHMTLQLQPTFVIYHTTLSSLGIFPFFPSMAQIQQQLKKKKKHGKDLGM